MNIFAKQFTTLRAYLKFDGVCYTTASDTYDFDKVIEDEGYITLPLSEDYIAVSGMVETAVVEEFNRLYGFKPEQLNVSKAEVMFEMESGTMPNRAYLTFTCTVPHTTNRTREKRYFKNRNGNEMLTFNIGLNAEDREVIRQGLKTVAVTVA